jgi:hypothetical protein
MGALNPREYADVRANARPLAPAVEAAGGGLMPAWRREGA